MKTSSMYSEFCSQSSVLPLESVSYDICCDLPAARVFASSVLKGNGQPGLFMCRSMLGSSQCPPPLWPHSPKPSSGQENLGSHPLLLCHSHSLFFFFKCYGWLEPHSRQANKLLSQLWVHSELTVQPSNFTWRTLIWLVWSMKTQVRTKRGSVLY